MQVKAFLCTEHTCDSEVTRTQIGAVQRFLERDPRVKEQDGILFISKEDDSRSCATGRRSSFAT